MTGHRKEHPIINPKRLVLFVCLLALTACQPRTVIVEKQVTREVVLEVEKQITRQVTKEIEVPVTTIVEKVVRIEITPTPTPIPQGGFLNLTSVGNVQTWNPLFAQDDISALAINLTFDTPLSHDPWNGQILPHLIEKWDMAADHQTVTFYVRRDAFWSDGQPITAADFKFTLDALLARDAEGKPVLAASPYQDIATSIRQVSLLDDYTLQVIFGEPSCANLESLNVAWLPAHVFMADPSFEFARLIDHPFNQNPTVFSGPFVLQEYRPDERIALARNPAYWQGAPYLDGISWRIVRSAAEEQAMLQSGETDLARISPQRLTEMEQQPHLDIFKFLRPAYEAVSLQQGDPTNPQKRLNEDGSLNEQHGVHPILGKKEVRQALAYAVDRNTLVNKVLMGQGVPLHTHLLPAYSWAYNKDIEPRRYDPPKAAEMLEAAGWVLKDKSPYRVCSKCGTAPDGTPMQLTLRLNADNETREDMAVLLQQQWGNVGVRVEIEPLEWNAYLGVLMGQTFDMILFGLSDVGPDSDEMIWSARYDLPREGLNFGSFYRPDYEELAWQARTTLGCGYQERGKIYQQIQEIIYEEQPAIWLYIPRTILGINKRVGNVNPGTWSVTHNIHRWFIQSR